MAKKAQAPAAAADPLVQLLAGQAVPIADACVALTAAGLRIASLVDPHRPGRVALIAVEPRPALETDHAA